MQRGQVSQVADRCGDALVNQHRLAELGPTVHDTVTGDRRVPTRPGQEIRQLGVVWAAIPMVEVEGCLDHVTRAKQRYLEAARSGVEYDRRGVCRRHRGDGHRTGCGQVQLLTSGRSSPCSLVQARCLVLVSTICCRSWPARFASPGTRSITSVTRWNRSMSFITTMSNGVVVVP